MAPTAAGMAATAAAGAETAVVAGTAAATVVAAAGTAAAVWAMVAVAAAVAVMAAGAGAAVVEAAAAVGEGGVVCTRASMVQAGAKQHKAVAQRQVVWACVRTRGWRGGWRGAGNSGHREDATQILRLLRAVPRGG